MKKVLVFCWIGIMLLGVTACTEKPQEAEKEGQNTVYFLNTELSRIIGEAHVWEATDVDGKIEEVYANIANQKEEGKKVPLLPESVFMKSWKLNGDTLWLDFNAEYGRMESPREILARAGIVRSFANIDEIENIGILVDAKELTDTKGERVGLLKARDFIEDSGKDVNAYQYVTMKLYFANEAGNSLVLEERKVYYSKNIPLERAVVEQLLEGPRIEGHYQTIPTETKILGVSALDGLGYVNLDQTFLDQVLPVQGDVAIQSIVKSVAEACEVSKVQISINGETKVEFRENISFDQFFEVNDSLVEVQND